ncbi:MAG: GWxTD domain-containing protein [candidate division WOR-3 bacterium]
MEIVIYLCHLILYLIFQNQINSGIETALYQFEEGYCEFWYKIPAENIFSIDELSAPADSIVKHYLYRFVVYIEKNDSVLKEGEKYTIIKNTSNKENYIFDYFPLYLPSGNFSFYFEIASGGEMIRKKGRIEVLPDTALFYTSDLLLSGNIRKNKGFYRKGVELIPLIKPEYSNRDILFCYTEIYGLVPDSLFYGVHYQIKDDKRRIIYDNSFKRLKYDCTQFDTLSILLENFSAGEYTISVEIVEPTLNVKVQKKSRFKIIESLPDITDEPLAWEIKYLISEKEYKKFLKMSKEEKKLYLKKFWSKRNYKEFETRVLEADRKFSTPFIRGRDTPMGKYYIINGPPDEVRSYVMPPPKRSEVLYGSHISEPQVVWVYELKGLQVIFKDINNDGTFELIGVSKLTE